MSPHEAKPLKLLNFKIIQEPLDGLIRNMDMDLRRRIQILETSGILDEHRELTLLLIMLRFAFNSYQAVGFLLSDLDEHPKRLPRFVVVTPPINRQLTDLWFTLVYMMDDFQLREREYDLCSYGELRAEIDRKRELYGTDPDWQGWFEDTQELRVMMESQLSLTAEQITNPKSLNFWPTPFKMVSSKTKSVGFIEFLHSRLYHNMSAEAHLQPVGLHVGAGILLSDIAPEHIRKGIEDRTIHQYKYMHLCQTVLAVLAVITEIELHCKLGNIAQIAKVWTLLADNNPDSKDVYEARYKALLG